MLNFGLERRRSWKHFGWMLFVVAIALPLWYFNVTPPVDGDWQEHLAILPVAEFSGDYVTVRDIRNFRYYPTEQDVHAAFYDRIFNVNELEKVWYITEPFKGDEYAAHTFLSFEFEGDRFLSITIEARKQKGESYSIWRGLWRTYPLVYIVADERDTVLLRANLRKDDVFVYPIQTTTENARKLFVDMLTEMNALQKEPVWYNTLSANCTSRIAYHVNKVSPGRIPSLSWRLWLTGYADELAMELGLLDTNLNLEQARRKYRVNELSLQAGDVENYSVRIRADM